MSVFYLTTICRYGRIASWAITVVVLLAAGVVLTGKLTTPPWMRNGFWITFGGSAVAYILFALVEGFLSGIREDQRPDALIAASPRSRFNTAMNIARGYYSIWRSLTSLALLAAILMWMGASNFTEAFPVSLFLLLAGGAMMGRAWKYWRSTQHDIRTGTQTELRRINCCPNCEYDLRSSAIRCPECGTAIHSENIEI